MSPSYQVFVRNGIKNNALDIQPICKVINISKTDKKIIKQREKERKEAIKIGKSKGNLSAIAEIDGGEFEIGDTIHCRIYLLNKVSKPSSDITDVAIDKSLSIKKASYELSWLEEVNIEEIDYNDSKYQKIGFAEILIVPEKTGNIKIPRIKLYGHKEIPVYKKTFNWSNGLPVGTDTFEYNVFTDPIVVLIK